MNAAGGILPLSVFRLHCPRCSDFLRGLIKVLTSLLTTAAGQGFTVLAICWGNVNVHRSQLALAGVADLVGVTLLDQDQRSSSERVPLAPYRGRARAGKDV